MPTPDIALFLTTAPDEDVAADLAQGLLSLKLAACVNLLPSVRSMYLWKGTLEDELEVQLVIKSRAALEPKIAAWLNEHHPYEEPELVMLPVIGGSAGYLAWVAEMTP